MLVYFICTGNTCRSPMAAALYYKHLNDNGTNYVQVETGGRQLSLRCIYGSE